MELGPTVLAAQKLNAIVKVSFGRNMTNNFKKCYTRTTVDAAVKDEV